MSSASDELLVYISSDDVSKIEKNVYQKIQDAWSVKSKEVDQFKIEVERCKADYDHQKFQLENELVSLRDLLEIEGRTKSEAEIKLKKTQEEHELILKENDQLKSRNKLLTQDLEKKINDHTDASQHSATLAGNLQARNRIIDQLKEQLSSLEEKYAVAMHTKCEAVIQAEEASSLQIQLEYKEKRLQKEHDLITRQMELLHQQLQQRTEESMQHRNDHSVKLLSLQTELHHKTNQIRSLEDTNQHLEQQLGEKTRRIDDLLESLKCERESEARAEETFRLQLAAEKKLGEIYRAASEDQSQSVKELEKAVQELRRLLQEASEQYGCLEAAKKKMEEDYLDKLESANSCQMELKDELDKVNTLLEASTKKDPKGIAEISPAAASVSNLVAKGLTLSQLYGEYLTTTEKLMESQEEVNRLNRYVEQVLQEIEERGPAIKKQREDYERSLETISALHAQMDDSLAELEKQRINSEEGQRKIEFLTRENGRLVNQVKDLSHQVTVLLLQAEDSRAGIQHSPMTSSAGDFISSRLVSFRSVSELQEQNTKLLANLRELTGRVEDAEKAAVETQTKELQGELEKLQTELEEIRSAKDRQQTLLDDMSRQRDMYRSLVQQQSPKPKGTPGQTPQGATTPVKEGNEKLQIMYDNANKEIASLKKNHADYVSEKAKNDKLVQDEMDRLRTSANKATNDNIKLLSQAEYNEERMKTAQATIETLQRQLNSVQENNTTLQGIVGRHEGSIDSLRSELQNMTKRLSQAEVMANNLKEECTLLKEANARLSADRENVMRNQKSTALVLSNLEMIKNNLDRSDSETKMRYENQITTLTEKLARAQSKLDSNVELKKLEEQVKTLEEKELAIKEQYTACKSQLESTKTEFANCKKELEELRSQSKVPLTSPVGRGRAKGAMSLVRLGGGASGASPTGIVKELQVQLTEEKAKSTNLNKNLDETKKHCDQLKNLNDQYEKQLKSATEASKVLQQRLDEVEKKSDAFEEELENVRGQLLEAKKTYLIEKENLKSQITKTQSELAAAKTEYEEMKFKLDETNANYIRAKREAQDSASVATAAQDKYEKEVMLHGADLQALATLKEKLASHTTDYEAINSAKVKAEEALRDTRLGFEERENILRQDAKELNSRIHELEDQNKNLLDQFTQLSDKMASIQTKLSDPNSDKLNLSFNEEEARSSDQLREVIKYLRRERDVAMGKCEVAQSESNRLQTQKTNLESQVNQLKTTLTTEREKAQVSLDSASKYSELLRKVQTMDALGDSNRLLREENEKLQNSVSEKHAQLTSIENQIGPLQKQLREKENRVDTLSIEKKAIEGEKEMYKRRAQDLVEKLNRAKPEDMLRLQQEVEAQKKMFGLKEQEVAKFKNHISTLQRNKQELMGQKSQLQQQVMNIQKQLASTMEDSKKLTEDNRKATTERMRFVQQINELKQKEMNLRKEVEAQKKDIETKENRIEEMQGQAEELVEIQKRNAQLRKIAKKYKQALEAAGADFSNTTGSDDAPVPASNERVKELEETISNLRQQIEEVNNDLTKAQEEATKQLQIAQSKDSELKKIKLQGVPVNIQKEMEEKDEELHEATTKISLLKQTLEKTNKKLEESETKNQQVEKEKEQLVKDMDLMKKSQSHLQKQPTGISKPSTSAISNEKASVEVPPMANIKPMAAPAATVSSPRSQTATQIVAPSRTIPTASIRPLASPASGQVSAAGSSVVIVSPLDSLSEGMVSSTVTLPQATVTPTPATPTPTQPTPCTTTLTATVSPTPATLSAPAVTAFPHQSSSMQITPPTSLPLAGATSSQSSIGSGPSAPLSAQPSTSAQVASVSPSTQMCSSFASVQPTVVAAVAPQQEHKQDQTLDADALISQAIAMVQPRIDQSQSASDEAADGSQPSGSHKRKHESQDTEEEEESKRKRVPQTCQEETVGPSSSHQDRASASKSTEHENVVFVESDEEMGSQDNEDSEIKEAEESHDGEGASGFHRAKQDQEREAEAEVNSGDEMEVLPVEDDTPSESTQSVTQSQQPQPSSGSSQASSTQHGVPAGLMHSNVRSPLRRAQDASFEGGVSTSGSPGTSTPRTAGESSSPRSGQEDGKFTEADSVASEVGEDDEQEEGSCEAIASQEMDDDEEEEGTEDQDVEDEADEVVEEEEDVQEVEDGEDDQDEDAEDDEEASSQSHSMHRRGQGSSESFVATSSSYAPRRRVPITWDNSETAPAPAQSISGRSISRGRGATTIRGQKAKRSRPHM